MPSPFPGMNPYLESHHWPGFHNWLIAEMARYLNQALPPSYYAATEIRVYELTDADGDITQMSLVGVADNAVLQDAATSRQSASRAATLTVTTTQPVIVTVPMAEEVTEAYLEVRETETHRVVTAVELLSPKNKQPGLGRQQYEEKRQQILSTTTHLVEIDLIRKFRPMAFSGTEVASDYRILVSRMQQRPRAELYAFNVMDLIPVVPIPLRSPDPDIALDLKPLLEDVYDAGAYARRVDYAIAPPKPEFSDEVREWCRSFGIWQSESLPK